MLGYPKMKGELEEAVKALDFEHTVILRPGLLVGDRQESRPAEYVVRKIAGFAGALSNGLKDFWAQDDEVVGKAAVSAGLEALKGEGPKVWMVAKSDIVRLGRTEWKAWYEYMRYDFWAGTGVMGDISWISKPIWIPVICPKLQ
jgi:hypothetical protein